MPENLVHFYFDVVSCVPVAVDIDGACRLEQSFHFEESGIQPYEVSGHAVFPDVVERAQLVVVAPQHVVLTSGEERGIDVYEVDGV